jgi:hypothetical protein
LKIKVLNIAKEECLPKVVDVNEQAQPADLIQRACKVLKIKGMDFSTYESTYQFEIKFADMADRKRIKFCFEQLIRIIEADG